MGKFFGKALQYVVARGREPSTYAGLAAGAAALGFSVDPGMLQTAAALGTVATSALAVFVKG